MKNVQMATTKLLAAVPKLNFLVLSTGFLNMKGRDDTIEGLPKRLTTDYYSRWKFIDDLMPLLRKAKDAGEDAKVLSVLAAGKGEPINLDDLGMKEYSLSKEMGAAATYNDIMIEVSLLPFVRTQTSAHVTCQSFAAQEPDMAFMHMYPGIVRTPLFYPASWLLKPLYPLWYYLSYFFAYSPSDSAEYILHALLKGERGSFRQGPTGDVAEKAKKTYFSTEEVKKKLWEHTAEITSVA
jgi:hypothetical protein